MNIEIFDDVIEVRDLIPKAYQNYILEQLTSLKFPWYYNPTMVSPGDPVANEAGNIAGFNHFLFEEQKSVSPFFDTMYPLVLSIPQVNNFSFQKIERMRFNLTLKNKTDVMHLPHIDSPYPHWNAIYYVNSCDGDTVIFNETNDTFKQFDYKTMLETEKFTVKHRVTPEQGKMVIFPGQYYHSSSFTSNSKHRIVLNINLGNLFDERF